jgi:hypothetical protein
MNRRVATERPTPEQYYAGSTLGVPLSAYSGVRKRTPSPVAIALVIILAALTVSTCVMAILELSHPIGDFGLRLAGGSDQVQFVVPGSPAAKAGIHAGDMLERYQTAPRDYALASGGIEPLTGDHVVAGVTRGILYRNVSLTAVPLKGRAEYALSVFFAVVATLTLFVVAALLVVLHPSWMTWGFFAFSLGSPIAMLPPGTPVALLPFWIMYLTLCFAASVAGMLIFLACFPNDSADYSWRIWVVRLAIGIGIAFFFALPNGMLAAGTFRGLQVLGGHGNLNAQLFLDALYVLGGIAFLSSYHESSPRDRQRIAWVAAAIACSIIGAIPYLLSYAFSNENLQYLLLALSSLILIPTPIAVAYAVLHHRVISVKFAVSRGVIYTIITVCIITLFAALHMLIGSVESSARWTVPLEFAVALATGFWLNSAHQRVNRTINQVLFRQRHEAEQRMSRAVAGLRYAENATEIQNALVREPYEELALTSAALFRKTDDKLFTAASMIGWPADHIQSIPADDRLVLHLRGKHGPLRMRDLPFAGFSKADASPVLVVPVFVRHQVEAIGFYGGHRNGGDFDREEVDLLENLANAAESAYDHLAIRDAETLILSLQTQLKAALSK